MPTLWIHMGTPKTGSTSLQGFFKQNEHILLERHNIYIPRSVDFGKKEHIRHNGAFLRSDAQALEQFLAEIQTVPDCDIIVSDEHLAEGPKSLNPKHFARIRESCPKLAIKTVTYLRRGDDNLKSAYNQGVKSFVRAIPRLQASKEYILQYDYNAYLARLRKTRRSVFGTAKIIRQSQKIVGVENTILRLFGKGFLLNDNIVDDFFNILGIDSTQGFTQPERKNPGLPLGIIPFFMTKSLPRTMPKDSRETLRDLAADTFTRSNTITDPKVSQGLKEEMEKLDAIYSKYTATLKHNKPKHTYMDLYDSQAFNINKPDFEYDRYTLYMIRQLNYVYHEMALLQKEVQDLRQVSLITMIRAAARKYVPVFAPLYTWGRSKMLELVHRRSR